MGDGGIIAMCLFASLSEDEKLFYKHYVNLLQARYDTAIANAGWNDNLNVIARDIFVENPTYKSISNCRKDEIMRAALGAFNVGHPDYEKAILVFLENQKNHSI